MGTEFTLEDADGDTISFTTMGGSDLVEISIPFNDMTMGGNTACVVLYKQDIARIIEKLDLPEVTNE